MQVHWLVVTLSVSSALAFSVSTTLKQASAAQVPDVTRHGHSGRLGGFIKATVVHPLWLAGIAADAAGLALQVAALHLGALALVQPLLVTGLLFALLLRHCTTCKMSRREAAWAAVLTGCLIALLAASGSASGGAGTTDVDRLPAALAALAGLIGALSCLTLARQRIPAASRAALIGLAAGVTYAATAALIKAATDVFATGGLLGVLASWQLYAVVVLGTAGLILAQLAFQAGPLTASLPAMSTVDPLLSVAIGVLVYDEHMRRGPLSGALLLALLLLLTASVVQLARAEPAEQQASLDKTSPP